jgi:hypothetical protein
MSAKVKGQDGVSDRLPPIPTSDRTGATATHGAQRATGLPDQEDRVRESP